MSAFGRVRRFYNDHLSVGDRLGESIYAVWMGVASIGLLNAETTITSEHINSVIAIAFGVNLVWGIIDGVTVMLTNVMDRRERDVAVYRLRAAKDDLAARAEAMANLGETVVGVLDAASKNRILDWIAAGPAGPDPTLRPARARREDWAYCLGIILIDVLLVVPLILPLVVIADIDVAVYGSRLVAATIFALLGAAYARNLGHHPLLAALGLGALGYGLFTVAYQAGW